MGANRAERRRRERAERKEATRRTPLALAAAGGQVIPRWNGEPCVARKCVIVVGRVELDTEWWARIVGRERHAVEVTYCGHTFYIDDEPLLGEDENPASIEAAKKIIASAPEELRHRIGDTRQAGYVGWGWAKVTAGRGSPRYGHRSLPCERVAYYLDELPDPTELKQRAAAHAEDDGPEAA